MKLTCPCPLNCKYCGAKRSRDAVGHRCKTKNCQWRDGYSTCTLHEKRAAPENTAKEKA